MLFNTTGEDFDGKTILVSVRGWYLLTVKEDNKYILKKGSLKKMNKKYTLLLMLMVALGVALVLSAVVGYVIGLPGSLWVFGAGAILIIIGVVLTFRTPSTPKTKRRFRSPRRRIKKK